MPTLGPVAMRIYTAFWAVLLAVAVVEVPWSVYVDLDAMRGATFPAVGLGAEHEPEGIVVVAVESQEARARGVRPGDVILAINGHRIPAGQGAREYAAARLQGAEGSVKRLTLRNGAEAPRDVLLTRSIANIDARYQAAGVTRTAYWLVTGGPGVLTSLLLIAAAILLFRQRRRSVAAVISFAFLCLVNSVNGDALRALGLGGLVHSTQMLGWGGLLIGFMSMPDGRFVPRWSRWLALAILIFTVQEMFVLLPSWMISVGMAMLLLAAFGVLALRYRRLPPGPARQQLRWVFFGFAVGAVLISLAVVVQTLTSPWIQGDPRWAIWGRMIGSPLVSLTMGALALGMMVSLMRYRLYDADAVIGRSASYALLTLLLAGTFGVSSKIIEWLFQTSFDKDAGALGAIGAGLAVVLIAPLHKRIQAWAERRFQKDLVGLRRDLPEAMQDMRQTATLPELADEVLARVNGGVHAAYSALVIDGVSRTAGAVPADDAPDYPVRIPLRAGDAGREAGELLVGPRPDGTPPGKDEREVLHEIAAPIARAIEAVGRRSARDMRLEERLAALEAQIEAIGLKAAPIQA